MRSHRAFAPNPTLCLLLLVLWILFEGTRGTHREARTEEARPSRAASTALAPAEPAERGEPAEPDRPAEPVTPAEAPLPPEATSPATALPGERDPGQAIVLSDASFEALSRADETVIARLREAIRRGRGCVVIGRAASALPESKSFSELLAREHGTTPGPLSPRGSGLRVEIVDQEAELTQCLPHLLIPGARPTAFGRGNIQAMARSPTSATEAEAGTQGATPWRPVIWSHTEGRGRVFVIALDLGAQPWASKTEARIETKSEPRIAPRTETEAETKTRLETNPEPKTKTEPRIETQSESKIEIKTETKTEPRTRPETDTETKTKTKTEPGAKLQAREARETREAREAREALALLAALEARAIELAEGREPTHRLPSDLPLAAEAFARTSRGKDLPGFPVVAGHFRGRRISELMSHHGADWLERRDREETEAPEKVLDALRIPKGSVVADLGAGVGYFTIRLARRVGAEGRVLAVEIQAEMLERLEARAHEEALENIDGILATEDDPKLPREGVDLVLMVDVYHELSDPEPVLAAVRRALRKPTEGRRADRPAGRLVLVEYRGEDPTVPIRPLHRLVHSQAVAELESLGFRWVETHEFLPHQRVIVLEAGESMDRPELTPPPSSPPQSH